jgi:ABC-2 type transport system permease protein
MRNVWLIWRKEMRSYFVSPVAYILLLMGALIFGYFFLIPLLGYLQFAMEAQVRGEAFPMNMPEEITRRFLGNIPVTELFIIPLITMRLFAEEKRTGTIELLTTSPIQDEAVILGKWLAATSLYCCLLAVSAVNVAFLFISATRTGSRCSSAIWGSCCRARRF